MTRPLHPCRQPGCPVLVVRGYCLHHARTAPSADYQRRRRADALKGEGRQFYSMPAWRALRAAVLREQPRCIDCGARSQVADHVIPRRECPELAMELRNLVARCKSCHDRRTARQGGGFGNQLRGEGASIPEDVLRKAARPPRFSSPHFHSSGKRP